MHPDQSAGQWHVGPSFRPTIFCLACVGLLITETLKSVSGFMATDGHDWDMTGTHHLLLGLDGYTDHLHFCLNGSCCLSWSRFKPTLNRYPERLTSN